MTETKEVAELSPALIQQFAAMVTVVPDTEGGNGEGIIAAILESTSLDDLDAPWTTKREIPTDRILHMIGITKTPSDYGGGLPFYVVVDTVMPSTGEIKQYTCGAAPVVAQLVKAHVNGLFPFSGQIVEVESKANQGWKSKHIIVSKDDTKVLREMLAKGPKK